MKDLTIAMRLSEIYDILTLININIYQNRDFPLKSMLLDHKHAIVLTYLLIFNTYPYFHFIHK